MRPSEAGHVPIHARLDGGAPPPPGLTDRYRSAGRQPSWPAETPADTPPPGLAAPRRPRHGRPHDARRVARGGTVLDPWPADPAAPRRDGRDDDTAPVALVPLPREEQVTGPDTPPRGLRKFDLGTVPASVTPPRTWRKAAWFAVGTSAAVVCGLAVAAVRLVGAPAAEHTIDALPAYPTNQLEIEDLPAEGTSQSPSRSRRPSTPSSDKPTRTNTARRTDGAPVPGSPAEPGTPGSTSDPDGGDGAGDGSSADTWSETAGPTEPAPPTRTTVGPAVTPTNPQQMGDRTEQYFALVTENPEAAHELCTGSMAREGPEGIEARYAGVERVEVQEITIDRNQAITTSTVKVVHEDGTETIEERQLIFTWGGDPKISDEMATG